MEDKDKKKLVKAWTAILILMILIFLILIIVIYGLLIQKSVEDKRGLADTVVSDGRVSNDSKADETNDVILFAGYSNVYVTADEPYAFQGTGL